MNVTMAEERRDVGVAEKMMLCKNYVGAREKLIRALQSSPATDIANQMMIVCDILSAASIKFPNFGTDYYWLLQLSPLCSDSDVNYRYQKLVKALKPSRYEIHGAKLASKLIRDAFSVLSDPVRRSAYDMKRADAREGYRSFNAQPSVYYSRSDLLMEATLQNSSSSRVDGPGSASGGNLIALNSSPETDVQIQEPSQVSDVMSSKENIEADTSMGAEKLNALDTDLSQSPKKLETCCNQDFYDFEKDKQNEKFEVGQIWAANSQANALNVYRYARVDNCSNADSSLVVTWLKPKPISSGERRWCEAGLPVACGSFEIDSAMRGCESWPMALAYKCSWVNGVTDEHYDIYPKRGEVWAIYKDWDLDRLADAPEDVKQCGFDFIEMLTDFSKYLGSDGVHLVKVDNFKSIFERKLTGERQDFIHIHPDNLFMFSHRVPSYNYEGGEIEGVVKGMIELDHSHSALLHENPELDQLQEQLDEEDSKCFSFTHTEIPTPLNTYSEYQCLSPSWSHYDFSAGQVWAVFCSEDFMPRNYKLVESVISENQVSVRHLDPVWATDDELRHDLANVAVYGIYIACETSTVMEMSQFSHVVKCQKSINKPFYKVHPRKGEIWAMCENWNPNWKHSDYATSQYGVVEIVAEFLDGVVIAKLEEVKGCLTFYNRHQQDGFQLTHVIQKSELLKFSHQIPAYRVPGIAAYRIPNDAWHLDPSALPPKI